ncbi:MAG: metallophosphoesterase [Elusimicrobia bacterium]|nr:metallophosphoesterase [Elusimicrobiota bacterium]
MKIGIMSDTHENMPMIAKAVSVFNREKVDLIFHAGDIISPITGREFKELKSKLVAVFGNNDGEKRFLREKFSQIGELHEPPYKAEVNGFSVLLMHQPDSLEKFASSGKYDIIIYGHTHRVDVRTVGETLIINPGEAGGWLDGKSTIGILELPSKKFMLIDLQEEGE